LNAGDKTSEIIFRIPKWYKRVTANDIGIVILRNHKDVFIAEGIALLTQLAMRLSIEL